MKDYISKVLSLILIVVIMVVSTLCEAEESSQQVQVKISTYVLEAIEQGDEYIDVMVKHKNTGESYNTIKYNFLQRNNISEDLLLLDWEDSSLFSYVYILRLTPEQIVQISYDSNLKGIGLYSKYIFSDCLYRHNDGNVYVSYTAEDALVLLKVAVGILQEHDDISAYNKKCYFIPCSFDSGAALMALQSSVGKIHIPFVPGLPMPG